MGQAALLQVALVVLLGAIEGRRGRDLGHDRAAEPPRPIEVLLRGAGGGLLLGRVDEDRRAGRSATVRALCVRGRRVVTGPEDLEELLVRDPPGVVRDL